MKLQSNKNTTLTLSLLSCLAILLFGSSASATYASLPEESFSLLPQTVTVSEGSSKNISDFGTVLGQRLAGVWQEVRGLVTTRDANGSVFSPLPSFHGAPDQAIQVSSFVSTGSTGNYFSDIATSPFSRYITLLAQEGIVAGVQGKFYPDNYLRLYDLIKMVVDLYRVKVWYDLDKEEWLSLIWAFSGDDSLASRYVATALHLGFFAHVTGNYTQMSGLQRFVSSQDMNQVFVNISYQFSGMIRPVLVPSLQSLARGQAAKYLVIAFDVSSDGISPYSSGGVSFWTSPFIDSIWHPYQSAISTLASLGVVSTSSTSFFPDNYLHRYDFVIMLVNASLSKQNKKLPTEYISGFVSPFVDVRDQSYSPFVYYAYDNELLEYLLVQKRGSVYFLPESLITKHEVYTILGTLVGKQFVYDVSTADTQYMTRAEFAKILVDLFEFTPPKKEVIVEPASQGSWGLLEQLSLLLQIKELLAKL